MTNWTLPLAIRAVKHGTGFTTSASDPQAAAAVEELAAAVEPKSGPGTYPEAFCAWPHSGGVLVARIRDVGHDEKGRAHTRRIEGGWFREPPSNEVLSRLLNSEAWPDEIEGGETLTLREPESCSDGDVIFMLPEFRGDRNLWRFNPDRARPAEQISVVDPPKKENRMFKPVVAVIIPILIVAVLVLLVLWQKEQQSNHENQRSLNEFRDRFNATKAEKETLEKANEDLQKQLNKSPSATIEIEVKKVTNQLNESEKKIIERFDKLELKIEPILQKLK